MASQDRTRVSRPMLDMFEFLMEYLNPFRFAALQGYGMWDRRVTAVNDVHQAQIAWGACWGTGDRLTGQEGQNQGRKRMVVLIVVKPVIERDRPGKSDIFFRLV